MQSGHQIESELKWALDAAGHAALATRLAVLLGPAHELAQENRFFDAAGNPLRAARMNLRLRREGAVVTLTCKRKIADAAAGLHRHDEWEHPVDPALWSLDPAALAARLPLPEPVRLALAGAPLRLLGGFANQRLEWRAGGDLLCLDRTDFRVRIDHELEIETADAPAARTRWTAQLVEWGVGWRDQPETKFARWLRSLGAVS